MAVNNFLDVDKAGRGQNSAYKGSSNRKSFQSPTRRSVGVSHKSSVRRSQDANFNRSPLVDGSEVNKTNAGPDPPVPNIFNDGFDMDDRYTEPGDFDNSDDDDDPWKHLNPHEPGNLKVKLFRKGHLSTYFFSLLYFMIFLARHLML